MTKTRLAATLFLLFLLVSGKYKQLKLKEKVFMSQTSAHMVIAVYRCVSVQAVLH